ncbi:hypothetical protein FOA52_013647 [Chlamydomonas sp. UWO 241]|nr:hypothetical protein FOA52_013647 [Chlamydomonas sp. UWO 241]
MPKAKADGAAKGAGKAKKDKDPNHPKRALGAYMFFCADKREAVKTEFPGLKVTEMASKMGSMWKEMDDAAKKPYQAKAEKDKIRYAKDMESYTPPE